MDDIVPLERCPVLVSWSENSSQVFDRLVEGVDVRTSVDIDCVSSLEHGGKSAVQLADGSVEFFDRIVFACSADATCAMLQRGTSPMPWFLSFLLSYVSCKRWWVGISFSVLLFLTVVVVGSHQTWMMIGDLNF